MYTLRIVEETRENEGKPFNQVIENFELGNSYAVIKKGAIDGFSEEVKKIFPEADISKIRAYLYSVNGGEFLIKEESPLSRNDYFIMSDSGQTFERL